MITKQGVRPQLHRRTARKATVVNSQWNFFNGDRREKTKAKLLDAIKPLSRGLTASTEDAKNVEMLAKELEGLNPTPQPLSSNFLSGKWRLLYTTSDSILGRSKPPPFRPSGPIYQYIDGPQLKAKNEETFPFFNQVTADLTPISKAKVAVQFKQFKLLNALTINAPPSARGALEITYLDSDLRISRGDKGNLFVLEMDDPSARL